MNNKILEKLYNEDIAERGGSLTTSLDESLVENDKKRRLRIYKLYLQGKIKLATDYHRAALIFQHGESEKDYKLAHKFAKKALAMGDQSAKWLWAATLDRLLLSSGKPQKYGTQFRRNSKDEWELALPIDPKVTDEERVKFNLPPLSQALSHFKAKYGL